MAADPDLYRYCQNNPVVLVDPSGLWTKPQRNPNKPWASTCAEEGDTWESLAAKLRLQPNEYQNWVREGSKGDGLPGQPKAGTTYHIPNVVIVYTSKPGRADKYFDFTAANYFRDVAARSARNYLRKLRRDVAP